jgi:formamidopyrimidine-DNA glycosylase
MPDARRFGRIRLQSEPREEPPISELGYDALDELPSARDLHLIMSRRNAPLKAVLLDQSLFAGVGNWIADEVLYQARLRPGRKASSLRPAETSRLRARLLAIVGHAVRVGADSDRFPRGWLFHYRWGRNAQARTPAGARIIHETIGGRTTAWVPSRQR